MTYTKLFIVRNVRNTDTNDCNLMRALRLINKLVENGNEIRLNIYKTHGDLADYEITVHDWNPEEDGFFFKGTYTGLYDLLYDGRWTENQNDGLHSDH